MRPITAEERDRIIFACWNYPRRYTLDMFVNVSVVRGLDFWKKAMDAANERKTK